jgi:predicted kinase
MMKTILAVMVGISGSGKSTFASNLKTSLNAELVETDAIRGELTGDPSDQTQNYKVFQIAKQRVENLLSQGKNVVIDATSVSVRDRKDWINIGKKHDAELRAYFINTSKEEAKRRNKTRERQVPDEVIDRQFSRLQMPKEEEGFDLVKTV